MKNLIVLEALKPLESGERIRKINLKSAWGWLRANALRLMGFSGAMAFISVCLSMEVTAAIFSMATMIFLWIDDLKEKGGRK